jgi:hypothetical protein
MNFRLELKTQSNESGNEIIIPVEAYAFTGIIRDY